MRIRWTAPLVIALLGLIAPAGAIAAPTLTEVAAPAGAYDVAAGADGNVWFTNDVNPGTIGRMTPSGTLSSFTTGLAADSQAHAITPGPGGVWLTVRNTDRIARVDAAGTITLFPVGAHHQPVGIVAGPDGNLWYTAWNTGGAIARMTPSGTVTEFTTGLTKTGNPQSITLGTDGNLYVTLPNTHRLARVTPQGTITELAAGGLTGTPQEIAAAPDGSVWFTETGTSFNGVGRLSPSGQVTEYSTASFSGSAPSGIVPGPDGNLYVTDPGADLVLSVTPSGTISQYGPALPAGANPAGVTVGPDGGLWFAEQGLAKLGRISLAPTAGASTASQVTDAAGTLSAGVAANSQSTTTSFQWGTTTGYGQTASAPTITGGGTAQTVSATLSGLTASTVYHARVVATNATGTSYGPDLVLTTTPTGAPSATSLAAGTVTATSATLNASVNPETHATTFRFEWGTGGPPYAWTVPTPDAAVGSDGIDHALSQGVTGLDPNTTYHFRVVATSSFGSTPGGDRSFTTAAVPPLAVTGTATKVAAKKATLSGSVTPQHSATSYHFEFGPTTAYGTSAPVDDALAGGDLVAHGVAQDVTELTPGTTYHFRVVAVNNAGTTVGSDRTFTTSVEDVQGDATGDAPATTAAAPPATPAADDEIHPAAAGVATPPAPATPQPELGRKAVAVATGTVTVRLPGSTKAVELRADRPLPSGTVIDATAGTIELETVVDAAGHIQKASFRGAPFRLGLSPKSGMVDLYLTQRPKGCGRGATTRAAGAQRPAALWGKDHHGKYRTHGRNSVATVRGTEWSTRDTCAGTITRVMRGSVAVADARSGRTTIVKAGHTHLAKPRS